MKSLFLPCFFVLFLVFPATAAETPDSAVGKIGETVEMIGKIIQVSRSSKGAVFLNFGAQYPNQVIYGYVSSLDVRRMGGAEYLKGLKGKTVQLSGKVELYKERPQIVLREPEQLRVKAD